MEQASWKAQSSNPISQEVGSKVEKQLEKQGYNTGRKNEAHVSSCLAWRQPADSRRARHHHALGEDLTMSKAELVQE